ncbi:MAG: hypothetical protein QNJ09_00415 [Paracoccaceae bacterium]|nr:hypothetical protein [Paracoccaceae bacterium]
MKIAESLSGGDRRSVGRTQEVVDHVLQNRAALAELVAALAVDDAVVRMRAADALEKVSAQQPRWVDGFAQDILDAALGCEQQEVRWHAAQTLPRLQLEAGQRAAAVELLFACLESDSRILRAFALTGLVDFAESDAALRARVAPLVEAALASDVPSMAARARKLAKRLQRMT